MKGQIKSGYALLSGAGCHNKGLSLNWQPRDRLKQEVLVRIQARLKENIPFEITLGIVSLWILSFVDYYFTVYHVSQGARELNPLLASFFNHHDYLGALLLKTVLTLPGIFLIAFFYKRAWVQRALFLVVIVYILLFVYHVLNFIL
ncbi:MAG: hypothetical protein DSZ23_03180 [Thermodesulfatator sp.]|nr:MAG: hypothetical protein DSZ23_03180 [Thermodesulfatator sp.]